MHYYANADTEMKREAIEKATSKLNPMVSDDSDFCTILMPEIWEEFAFSFQGR